MYRRYNLLFYSQFSCAIACFLFSNISVSFCLAFSMYFLSSEDGLNDLFMSIGSTRYSPDSVHTRDRTTYSQFLNPVGHDVTMITSFDIPCNLWPVVASLLLAGICLILQLNRIFCLDPTNSLTDTFVENSSGSSLKLRSLKSVDNFLFKF